MGDQAINPRNIKAHYFKAKSLLKRKEFSDAHEALDAALNIDPENASVKGLANEVGWPEETTLLNCHGLLHPHLTSAHCAQVRAAKARSVSAEKQLFKRMVSALDGSSPDVQAVEAIADTEVPVGADGERWGVVVWVLLGILVLISLTWTWSTVSSAINPALPEQEYILTQNRPQVDKTRFAG